MAYGQLRQHPIALAELIPVLKHQLAEISQFPVVGGGGVDAEDGEFIPDALRTPKP